MKTLLTLCGWVVVGAVLAFGGQQIWKAYKANNPERSETIAEKVTDAVDTSTDALRETADAVREELASSGDAETDAKPTDEVAEPAAVAESETKEEPVTSAVTDVPKKPVSREASIEERFYAIAAGDAAEENAVSTDPIAKVETAAAYEKRQEANRRKEEVLIQRQMRIVDELTGK